MFSFNFILIEITFAGRNEPHHWMIRVKETEPRICSKGTVMYENKYRVSASDIWLG
jgi:hypothetical protein